MHSHHLEVREIEKRKTGVSIRGCYVIINPEHTRVIGDLSKMTALLLSFGLVNTFRPRLDSQLLQFSGFPAQVFHKAAEALHKAYQRFAEKPVSLLFGPLYKRFRITRYTFVLPSS